MTPIDLRANKIIENCLKRLQSLKDTNEEAKRKIDVAKGVFKVNYFCKCKH